MLDPKQLDEFARRFSESLPSGVREMQSEFEKNARAALQDAASRMDLVTREEFDAQAKVLARTREKVDALEARIAELEQAQGASKAKTGSGKEDSES
jgi:BMFP domain-containing protein YqiC